MIVCPNCNHQNPDGAVQCEACYTPLPALATCPSCNASVQSDASFCGQCGFDLRTVGTASAASAALPDPDVEAAVPRVEEVDPVNYELTSPGISEVEIPDLLPPAPLVVTEPASASSNVPPSSTSPPTPYPSIPAPMEAATPETAPPEAPLPAPVTASTANLGSTQLQINQAKLLHVQTSTPIELPSQLSILHMGKPNDRIPPTIDVSGFPNSEIVSRIHANIRVEGDIYYLEDVGSSNGTYINNLPLPPGNRHRLRAGDRIALGKGDKVTFIFQSG